MKRLEKYARLILWPAAWPALLKGVAPTVEHAAGLGGHGFRTVIDVGANKGQFAKFAALTWPTARIICFEPLPAPRARLEALMGPKADIFGCALGTEEGEAEMHITARDDSSSLRAVAGTQAAIFGTEEVARATVPVRRLDACVTAGEIARPALLKIDVQGFEREVLAGATALLPAIDVAYVEASFIELYEGQALAGEIIATMQAAGLQHTGTFNQHDDPEKGPVQADLLFERPI